MTLPFLLPTNAQQPLDPRTGAFNRPWYLFFQAVFERIGGASGTGNVVLDQLIADLQISSAMDADPVAVAFKQAFDDYVVAQAARDAAQNTRLTDLETLAVFA